MDLIEKRLDRDLGAGAGRPAPGALMQSAARCPNSKPASRVPGRQGVPSSRGQVQAYHTISSSRALSVMLKNR
jgi:hypothetical protein